MRIISNYVIHKKLNKTIDHIFFLIRDSIRLRPFFKWKAASSGGRICRLHNVIKPGLFQLTEHYICESKAYYNNLHLTKNNGQIYNY